MHIQFPHKAGKGGPGSFQIRFENGLKEQQWETSFAHSQKIKKKPNLIFITGGTQKLFWLIKMKLKHVPIVYRLDGIVWLHKRKGISYRVYFLSEIRNLLSKVIHAYLADVIVYQSNFVKQWWDKEGFRKAKDTHIIYNGVAIPNKDPVTNNIKRLVVLEGTIDYSPYAVRLLNELAHQLPKDIYIELYGRFSNSGLIKELYETIEYKGFVQRDKVYNVFKGSVYLSLDINPACPNTVAEALACGAPVVGFNTGALGELVDQDCGVIVEYGADPWSLAYPDVNALIQVIPEVFANYKRYSENARLKAANEYDQDEMVQKYMNIIEKMLSEKN